MYLSWIHTAVGAAPDERARVVHPFYADTFSALYHIAESDFASEEPYLFAEQFPLSVLRATLSELNDGPAPEYFFDIRTTEEFTRVAPDYDLLYRLRMNRASPLSVKGMGSLALIQGFAIASVYLRGSRRALFCLDEQYHRLDSLPFRTLSAKAAAFVLSADGGEIALERFGFLKDRGEIPELLHQGHFDRVFLEDSSLSVQSLDVTLTLLDSGLVDPFASLSAYGTQNCSFRFLVLLKYRDSFGFYILRKERSAHENKT